MREILFRGKRTDNGKWVYGLLGRYNADFECANIIDEFELLVPVKTESVGQYTGLMDKNGNRIFEWDIVKITDRNVCFDTIAVIEFGNPNGLYTWGWQLKPLENKPFAVEILNWVDMEDSGAFIEVIGNIHDNPELLKGEKENEKMTDNAIIKALECCKKAKINQDCVILKCPFSTEYGCNIGLENLRNAALDLINRQKARIKELEERISRND